MLRLVLTRDRFAIGLGLVLWCAAAALAYARTGASVAVDFQAMYGAGHALLHGHPLYDVPDFVYPPFAALIFAPFALMPSARATYVYSIIQVVVPLLASTILGVMTATRHKVLWTGVLAVSLMKADVFVDSLFFHNPSLLFVVPLILVAACWGAGRRRWGALILGVSLAVKPLLVLLILVPILRKDWRTVVAASLTAGIPTLLILPFAHDLSGLLELPRRILSGTNLHGSLQAGNVSLGSVAVVHPSFAIPIIALRLTLTVLALVLLWRSMRWQLTPTVLTVLLGALALLLPVVGSLNEMHYCVLALPACAVLATGRMGRLAQAIGIIAGGVLIFPLFNINVAFTGQQAQLRYAAGSALALLACCLATPRVLPSRLTENGVAGAH